VTVTVTVIVTMTVAVTVTMTMAVVKFVEVIVTESMTVGLHLYFRVAGRGNERVLYPPSGWSHRIRELDIPSS
jgi:hypothetical protein